MIIPLFFLKPLTIYILSYLQNQLIICCSSLDYSYII
nr:MAG TPA: hypothetical protein [Inoviridae sp.]